MRFMVLVKADKDSEAGVMPSRELVAAMERFNEEMMRAGVMLAGEGLHPSSKGTRVSFSGGKPTVSDGPFKGDLIAGFWMIQVPSKADAVAWASRAPFQTGQLEIRQVFEASDFPADVLPPEEAAREQAMRDELQKRGAQR